MDTSDRMLREISIGLGPKERGKAIRSTGFDITVSVMSESESESESESDSESESERVRMRVMVITHNTYVR